MSFQEQFKDRFEQGLLKEIEENGKLVTIPAGETIIKFGDTIRLMPIILSGVVKISRLDEEGKEILLYYVNPLESCAMTFTCCMQHKASEIQAVAEEEVQMIAVPIDFMDKWMDEYPSWKSFVMQTIQSRFDELLHTVDQIAFKKLDDRLVNYLIEKSAVTGSKVLNLSHEQIAQDLATSRVVVSRLLKKLENDNKLLLYRNQIKLLKAM